MANKSKTQVALYILLGLMTLITLFPFLYAVLTAFKPLQEMSFIPPRFFPEHFTTYNFKYVWSKIPIPLYLFNSLVIAVAVTSSVIFTSSIVGFVFAKYGFRFKEPLFMLLLSTMMLPIQVIFVPTYLVVSAFHMGNSYWGIILPNAINIFGIFYMREFIIQIPQDLFDAARLDGCSDLKLYFHIVVPNSVPAIVSLSIFQFIWTWNDFLWPLIVAQSNKLFTMPVGISAFAGFYAPKPNNYVMSAAIFEMVPVIIAYFIFQRHIIRGVTLSGMKF
ncbi:MAG: carbohydrate ABC transporter permease [Thermotoga sp.]|nr:MAG: carbohydrate ABC transporter permease [Thermotoga sp.]